MLYQLIKRYGHEQGWSCTFRQWRAGHSHCKFIHGYPLAFEVCFACEDLNDLNWCLDFGGLKELKTWLEETFDHKMVIAVDDPEFDFLMTLKEKDLADIVVVPDVGCEKFAEMVFKKADLILDSMHEKPRVWLQWVKVSEHGANNVVCSGSRLLPNLSKHDEFIEIIRK